MDSHGNDWINDLAADTELTLRFPGNPPPVKSRRRRSSLMLAGNSSLTLSCDEMPSNVNNELVNKPGERNSNIGWPPVRGRRKKSEEEEEESLCYSCILVKVAVDGAPFLRKVDLGAFSTYQDLLRELLEMFSCFTVVPTRVKEEEEEMTIMMMMMKRRRVVVKGIEYIPTYEDKDGDWMLLGDVPWEMFKQSCKRIRLVKS